MKIKSKKKNENKNLKTGFREFKNSRSLFVKMSESSDDDNDETMFDVFTSIRDAIDTTSTFEIDITDEHVLSVDRRGYVIIQSAYYPDISLILAINDTEVRIDQLHNNNIRGLGVCIIKWVLLLSLFLGSTVVYLSDDAKISNLGDTKYRKYRFDTLIHSLPTYHHELSYYYRYGFVDVVKRKIDLTDPNLQNHLSTDSVDMEKVLKGLTDEHYDMFMMLLQKWKLGNFLINCVDSRHDIENRIYGMFFV